jgi:hypothetical protein|tara:strand:- start:79 stop:1458 length:1380 start_codon:yes stop_codon:yes gene_type:complete
MQLLVRGTSSLLFGIQIIISEVAFKRIALILTEYENHRTTTSHRAHFVAKAFIFSIINNFSSVIYMTYFDDQFDIFHLQQECGQSYLNTTTAAVNNNDNDDLYSSLLGKKSINLFFLLVSNILLGNFIEVLVPIIFTNCSKHKPCHAVQQKVCCCGKHHEAETSETTDEGTYELVRKDSYQAKMEKKIMNSKFGKRKISTIFTPLVNQSFLMEFDLIEQYDNLSDLIVSYTFATAFAAAFPLGCLLASVGLCIELRLDLYQQCRWYRRPYPQEASHLKAAELLLGYTDGFVWLNNGLILCLFVFPTTGSGGVDDKSIVVSTDVIFLVIFIGGVCFFFGDFLINIFLCNSDKNDVVTTLEKRFEFRANKILQGAELKSETTNEHSFKQTILSFMKKKNSFPQQNDGGQDQKVEEVAATAPATVEKNSVANTDSSSPKNGRTHFVAKCSSVGEVDTESDSD